MKKAFTLAEVMIVLTVIGVLTAILLPVARQSMPDENLMKFKKAHNTLGTVIRELVTSDKYYLDGDLGVKPNNELIDGTHEGDVTYFCETIADVLNVKSANCYESYHTIPYVDLSYYDNARDNQEQNLDIACKTLDSLNTIEPKIEMNDGSVFVQTASKDVFGISMKDAHALQGVATDVTTRNYFYTGTDKNGGFSQFLALYKIVCIDIDGLHNGEEPFGYGIRVDGKILVGARAQQWLEREVNDE